MKKIFLAIAVIGLLAACSNEEKTTTTETTEEVTAAIGGDFYCPMKCEGEKTFAEAGKCSVCKMDLVSSKVEEEAPVEEAQHDHKHEHNHGEEGHQH